MARIRTVKPEMRRSLTVSSWPIPVRWTFVGLICYLDDHGRALDDLRLIKAELYPLDDSVTIRKLDQHLATITDHGPLCRYKVAGQGYLHVVSWGEHQRVDHPTASRIPPCPLHEASREIPEPFANGSRDAPEPFGASRARAEQGKEGKGKEVPPTAGTVARLDPTADGLIAEWLDHTAERPPGQVIARVGKELKAMTTEGISPDYIRAGLAAWATKGASPASLPSFVHEAQTRPIRRSTTDERVGAALDLARQYALEDGQ